MLGLQNNDKNYASTTDKILPLDNIFCKTTSYLRNKYNSFEWGSWMISCIKRYSKVLTSYSACLPRRLQNKRRGKSEFSISTDSMYPSPKNGLKRLGFKLQTKVVSFDVNFTSLLLDRFIIRQKPSLKCYTIFLHHPTFTVLYPATVPCFPARLRHLHLPYTLLYCHSNAFLFK